MTALIAGTWSLISSSAEVITRARRLTLRIQGLLQPGNVDLSEGDRRGLLGLQKRVECLVSPLNFLLTRMRRLDSCVQQVVQNTQDVLFDVCSFVERCSPDLARGAPSSAAAAGASGHGGASGCILDGELLEHYLRELEFACASVNMAVSILRATGSSAEVLETSEEGSSVSLTSLLSASERIQGMSGRSGDLCTCNGQLFSQGSDGAWSLLMASSSLMVRADERLGCRRYLLCVEPSADTVALTPQDAKTGAVQEAAEDDQELSGPLGFRIEVALDSSLADASALSLPRAAGRQALLWQGGSSASSSALCEFPDAELVSEDALDSPSSGSFWQSQQQRRLRAGLSPEEAQGGCGQGYAFVFSESDDSADSAGADSIKPIEVLYMARLCALDDGQQQLSRLDGGDQSALSGSACPPHLLSSDELLATLLATGPSFAP